MHVTKCDACGKTIKKSDAKLNIGGKPVKGWGIDLCEKCAAPYLALLKKSGLVETEDRY
jgi:hypothetical protein